MLERWIITITFLLWVEIIAVKTKVCREGNTGGSFQTNSNVKKEKDKKKMEEFWIINQNVLHFLWRFCYFLLHFLLCCLSFSETRGEQTAEQRFTSASWTERRSLIRPGLCRQMWLLRSPHRWAGLFPDSKRVKRDETNKLGPNCYN